MQYANLPYCASSNASVLSGLSSTHNDVELKAGWVTWVQIHRTDGEVQLYVQNATQEREEVSISIGHIQAHICSHNVRSFITIL